jgi:hypothetical protein
VYVNGHHSWVAILVFAAVLILRLATSRRRRSPHPRNPPAGSAFTASSPPATSSPASGTAAGSTFTGTAPGWFTDPFVRHEQRYWSGTAWTEHVMDSGTPAVDPPPPPASPSASAA